VFIIYIVHEDTTVAKLTNHHTLMAMRRPSVRLECAAKRLWSKSYLGFEDLTAVVTKSSICCDYAALYLRIQNSSQSIQFSYCETVENLVHFYKMFLTTKRDLF
jgi:hypothetical protein